MGEAPFAPISAAARRAEAIEVVQRLRAGGHVAYFAGGCVRDQLLGLPAKDYDVATDAPPDRVRALFRNTQAVGAAFGVILVRLKKSLIEVATFRSDLKYTDGRHPQGVVFTTAEEDARRRDFTINGMFYDPLSEQVIDYVGGQEDLKARVLRAIGDPALRFEEDHLRMLRAIRFASRFGLKIDPATARAIATHADQLKRISPERIGEELRMILTAPSRAGAFTLLRQLKLLGVIMRFLPEKQTDRPGEALSLFLALSPPSGEISLGLALATLTLDYRMHASGNGDPLKWLAPAEIRRSVGAMRQALKISNDEADGMAGSLSFGPLIEQPPPTVARMKRFLAQPASAEARRLMAALAHCSIMKDRIEQRIALLDAIEQAGDIAPAPLITGDDLTAAGLTPGPVFKRVLDAVYDAQLEDRISAREQALDLALKLAEE